MRSKRVAGMVISVLVIVVVVIFVMAVAPALMDAMRAMHGAGR